MPSNQALLALLQDDSISNEEKVITQKVLDNQRISTNDALYLYNNSELAFLGILANYVRESKNGDDTFFNKNFHIEPTNVCVYSCAFCAYSRLIKNREDGWEMTMNEMMDIVRKYDDQPVTEVHFTGGVLPQYDVKFYEELFRRIKKHRPELHIKGLTPVEYHYIFKKEKLSYREGMERMKAAGLDSMPGGGAEIFDKEIRDEIAGGKCSSEEWLEIHEIWHELGMRSNATMLYGHIETFAHRVDHLDRLRKLQDKTQGFMAFIPLKFRNKNNQMSHVPEVSPIEDLRNYAISRLFLDNFQHLKAYWPMIGRDTAQMALAFGVNDMDGTIDDTTKIYTMAGSEEQSPAMTTAEIVNMIRLVGRKPIERDTLFNPIKDYSEELFAEDTQYRGYTIK